MCCPTCRQAVSCPVEKLPVNFALQNAIADTLRPSGWLCQPCCAERKLEVATARCDDCQRSVCGSCGSDHAGRRHSVAPLADRECEKHRKKLELRCSGCRLNVCVLCYSEAHRGHDCDAVGTVAERLADRLRRDIEQLGSLGSRLVDAQTVVEGRKKLYESSLSKLEECANLPVAGQQLSAAQEAFRSEKSRENVAGFMTTKKEAAREIVRRHNDGMPFDREMAGALVQDARALVGVFLSELNRRGARLQGVLNETEMLKARAVDVSLTRSACDLTDNEARILGLADEIKALLQDPIIREVCAAVQETSNLASGGKGMNVVLCKICITIVSRNINIYWNINIRKLSVASLCDQFLITCRPNFSVV